MAKHYRNKFAVEVGTAAADSIGTLNPQPTGGGVKKVQLQRAGNAPGKEKAAAYLRDPVAFGVLTGLMVKRADELQAGFSVPADAKPDAQGYVMARDAKGNQMYHRMNQPSAQGVGGGSYMGGAGMSSDELRRASMATEGKLRETDPSWQAFRNSPEERAFQQKQMAQGSRQPMSLEAARATPEGQQALKSWNEDTSRARENLAAGRPIEYGRRGTPEAELLASGKAPNYTQQAGNSPAATGTALANAAPMPGTADNTEDAGSMATPPPVGTPERAAWAKAKAMQRRQGAVADAAVPADVQQRYRQSTIGPGSRRAGDMAAFQEREQAAQRGREFAASSDNPLGGDYESVPEVPQLTTEDLQDEKQLAEASPPAEDLASMGPAASGQASKPTAAFARRAARGATPDLGLPGQPTDGRQFAATHAAPDAMNPQGGEESAANQFANVVRPDLGTPGAEPESNEEMYARLSEPTAPHDMRPAASPFSPKTQAGAMAARTDADIKDDVMQPGATPEADSPQQIGEASIAATPGLGKALPASPGGTAEYFAGPDLPAGGIHAMNRAARSTNNSLVSNQPTGRSNLPSQGVYPPDRLVTPPVSTGQRIAERATAQMPEQPPEPPQPPTQPNIPKNIAQMARGGVFSPPIAHMPGSPNRSPSAGPGASPMATPTPTPTATAVTPAPKPMPPQRQTAAGSDPFAMTPQPDDVAARAAAEREQASDPFWAPPDPFDSRTLPKSQPSMPGKPGGQPMSPAASGAAMAKAAPPPVQKTMATPPAVDPFARPPAMGGGAAPGHLGVPGAKPLGAGASRFSSGLGGGLPQWQPPKPVAGAKPSGPAIAQPQATTPQAPKIKAPLG